MTHDELWCYILSKNVSLNGGDEKIVSLSIGNIRKLFDLAYKHGDSNGFDRCVDIKKQLDKVGPETEMEGLFKSMFGGKK